ncbi:unnamed protein product [Rotaria magnacalcarata]|uniref:Peptidase S1 domain-containing protein n=1 Tax=Rotaria magnacalcarata TaxID=392030 RepID=A0A819H0S6_9BILA|nr:unnamed protein product [Rotaria magnacalcarata]CAF2092500.1 unnamed protein product [Rotaria magnacalcarata]CAF2135464.1 unnamed protein product [Rotaria magnacalcarata]CAF3890989.1 unnamed protein product [Rotaria magnacalcarata]CAF3930194.1 unnamed protein product [Rotaria magnacalcarata]
MRVLIPILACFLFYSSKVFAGQELSSSTNNECDPAIASWTSWFNTQNPKKTNGNDVEDISFIRNSYAEAARCEQVLNVEYSVLGKSNNDTSLYQTLVNHNGVFCMGSPTSRCPDYSVRFCCRKERQQCGQTFRQPQLNSLLRIVNGFEARPHSLPWVVSLQYKGVHDCGGIIIDQWHILTAAHCLDYSNDLQNYFARVGAHNKYTSGQLLPIAELIIHPTYNEERSTDDIGIVKLAAPINFSQDIQPICLFDSVVEPPLDATVFVAGWGNTVHEMWTSSSPVLLQAQLRVISDCSMYFAYEPQKQICTAHNGPADRDHGSCQGDSGGGLLYFKDGRWYAAGVVSYAIGCGRQAFPTVFTKIASYMDWIRPIINRSTSN